MKKYSITASFLMIFLICPVLFGFVYGDDGSLQERFANPPESAKPWVYWFVRDGNLSKEGITADLEAMKAQGIGGVIFMEITVGAPLGRIDFMSEEWQDHIVFAIHEAERLGLQFTLTSGPGWAGSGGPWIEPKDSMIHLVASEKSVSGPTNFRGRLDQPRPRAPFFGENLLPPDQEKARREFYQDRFVLAFPEPDSTKRISNIDEKALYVRAPYSSQKGVAPRLENNADPSTAVSNGVPKDEIIDLTGRMSEDGTLSWDVPEGRWTIMRFGVASTGANTRPAPKPGLGLESSKLDQEALDLHFKNFIGRLLEKTNHSKTPSDSGWTFLHIDSWEMGAQNWSKDFADEFLKRRGYEMIPFLPAYSGVIVENENRTERFLWDVRLTAQELLLQNHAERLKSLAHENGLKLSIEPYDMNPASDLALGSVADVPMSEFWSPGGFDTRFSVLEASSLGNLYGRSTVAAEAFTSGSDAWRSHPRTMKQQGDWAFCAGINRFVFHRYQHQPYLDRFPGMTMSGYGIHWERTQSFWPLISGYHRYLARCQFLLQQGTSVVDCLYLTPEGAPQVFTPPKTAFCGDDNLPDQRGYRFDGCDPETLIRLADVRDGKIVFPSGASYRLLILPDVAETTPRLLEKLDALIQKGAAVVVGRKPTSSPSLSDYPDCDRKVQEIAANVWGDSDDVLTRSYGKGTVYRADFRRSPLKNDSLDRSKWIWFNEGKPENHAPAGTRYFSRTFTIDDSSEIRDAAVLLAADNRFVLNVNGRRIGNGVGFSNGFRFDVGSALKTGENVVEIEAVNDESSSRNPAGLIALIKIAYENEILEIPSDATWAASLTSNGEKTPALELGPATTRPWGVPAFAREAEIYPPYSTTENILKNLGVPVDFETDDDSLRFIHRTFGENDIYFVSNKRDRPFSGCAKFRVVGKRFTILDPLTGKQYRLSEEDQKRVERGEKQTIVPISLQGSDAVFFLFEPSQSLAVQNLPVWNPLKEKTKISDESRDWTVRFDPKFGGPEEDVRFETLQDWTRFDDPRIRFYSGKATYRKTIRLAANDGDDDSKIELDLGSVEAMAQVSVNGKNCGVVWKSPYLVDITDALKIGDNDVEIEVCNLWINRLIADADLPESERTTWSTWNPYRSTDSLVPSGWIGPAVLLKSPLDK